MSWSLCSVTFMSDEAEFDSEFDMRSDTPEGKDPDTYSPTLRRYHRMLWSKELPGGMAFTLEPQGRSRYLVHDSDLGRFVLGSDTIATSHPGELGGLYSQASEGENAEFHRVGRTIGGHIVFPGVPTGGKQTINQARGLHPSIEDRFDLTLEAIRRHYARESSPLADTLAAYTDFFELFRDFAGYVSSSTSETSSPRRVRSTSSIHSSSSDPVRCQTLLRRISPIANALSTSFVCAISESEIGSTKRADASARGEQPADARRA